jgi:hypothetical protein
MQIGEQLRFVDWQDVLYSLQFKDDTISDNQVYTVSAIKLDGFVGKRKIDLLSKSNAAKLELVT